MLFRSVVIDSYQVPRDAKAWPWLARHGHNVVIILQPADNAQFQPIRIEINFRSIVPIFLFSICCPFDLLSGHQNSIIRNFVRKWNKLPRALRKEKSKKKFKKELKEEMQNRQTSSNGQKN